MSQRLAYAQLVRLPNVPSALADIALGALAVGALPRLWLPFLCLCVTSACLYMAGMVYNDLFDVDEDKRERPDRPIPSGRISLADARRLGRGLLLVGILFAVLASRALTSDERTLAAWLPRVITLALVVAIFAYDGWLKQTDIGPVSMGLCRFLNVLLGLSLAGGFTFAHYHLAFVVGLYIVGVTWLAKTEAKTSNTKALRGAGAVLLVSLLLALPLPVTLAPLPGGGLPAGVASPLFPFLLVAFGLWLGLAVWDAIQHPEPTPVQAAVKRCLMGLIVLDAILASAVAGTIGLTILLLMVPSVILNRRRQLYAT